MFKHRRINWVAVGLIVVLLVGVGAAGYVFAEKLYNKEPEVIEVEREKIVEKIVEKETVISGETIQSEIRNIGKLCTAEYRFTHVESFEDKMYLTTGNLGIPGTNIQFKDIAIPFTTSTFIYSYDGNVMAGVDFDKVSIYKNDQAKTIKVMLPAVGIISSSVDPESFKLYDEKNSIFNPYHVTDMADSFTQLIKSEEVKAINDGLLTEAKENAVRLLENFIRAGYNVQDYTIDVMYE